MEPNSLLAAISAADLAALRACSRVIKAPADHVVLKEGEHNDALFIVESGRFHASRMATKRRVFLGQLPAGSAFGEVSLFDPGPATATVAAVEDGVLLKVDRDSLNRFQAEHPVAAGKLLVGLVRQMAQRLRRTDNRLIDSLLWGNAPGGQ